MTSTNKVLHGDGEAEAGEAVMKAPHDTAGA